MKPTSLRALIFDVDGTLADTERDGHRLAFNRAFAELELPWQWSVEEYGRLLAVTGGRERLLHHFDKVGVALTLREREQLAVDLHRRKTAHYARCVRDGALAWRPGVLRLLAEAHDAGMTLAIATTTSRANVDVLLEHAPLPRLSSWFATIAAAEDAPRKKPDPSVYRCVLQRLRLPASACLAIEDSAAGLLAARGAGIATLVTINDYTRGQDFVGALSVVPHLGDAGDPVQSIDGLSMHRDVVDMAQLATWWRDAARDSTNRHADVT